MLETIGNPGQAPYTGTDATLTRNRIGPDIEASQVSYLLLLSSHWRLIVSSALIAIIVSALITGVLMTKSYQALAVIRPVPQQSQQANLMGGVVGGFMSGGANLLSILGGSQQSDIANEYISIAQSFDFTIELVRKHKLAPHLRAVHGGWNGWVFGRRLNTDWAIYKLMSELFGADFDSDQGNLTFTFVDPEPAMARKILGFYVADLREKEQRDQASAANSALTALREAALHSADPTLQSELYQMSAAQLEMSKAATAQADFAFKEIQTPVVPSRAYSPRPALDSALAGIAAVLLTCIFLIARDALRRAREQSTPRSEINSGTILVRRNSLRQ